MNIFANLAIIIRLFVVILQQIIDHFLFNKNYKINNYYEKENLIRFSGFGFGFHCM